MAVAQLLDLGSLDDAFLATGRYWVTIEEAAKVTEASAVAARSALRRMVLKKRAFSPARGLFVFVPPEYRSWGVVPLEWFIDPMMKRLDRSYYVGLLSAAEIHGAAHQRAQVAQVFVDRALDDRDVERVRLRFFSSAKISAHGIERRNSKTGTFLVSSPELTVIDMCTWQRRAGGIDNVATVISELADDNKLDVDRFNALASEVEASAWRRTGFLVEQFSSLLLDAAIDEVSSGAPTLLDPHGPRSGAVDRRWNVRANVEVDPEA